MSNTTFKAMITVLVVLFLQVSAVHGSVIRGPTPFTLQKRPSNTGSANRNIATVQRQLTQMESVERYYQQLFLRGYLSEEASNNLHNIQAYIDILRNYLDTAQTNGQRS
ncbi:uncharacterized protein LOC128230370 [Mya arenaria]|uniref:uncharacterized protein LOC128230370 n=1 Tax=Mya arenaria TaxID=6604 RepID=UPI0022E28C67|nr:uncharacterized protein LOC128230370 [Mya arenaria]